MSAKYFATSYGCPGIEVSLHRVENGRLGPSLMQIHGPLDLQDKYRTCNYLISQPNVRFAIVIHLNRIDVPFEGIVFANFLNIRVEMDGHLIGTTSVPRSELTLAPFVVIDRCAPDVANDTARSFVFTVPSIALDGTNDDASRVYGRIKVTIEQIWGTNDVVPNYNPTVPRSPTFSINYMRGRVPTPHVIKYDRTDNRVQNAKHVTRVVDQIGQTVIFEFPYGDEARIAGLILGVLLRIYNKYFPGYQMGAIGPGLFVALARYLNCMNIFHHQLGEKPEFPHLTTPLEGFLEHRHDSLYRYYMRGSALRPAMLNLGAPLWYNTGIPSAPDQPAPNAVQGPLNVPAALAAPAAATGGADVTAPTPAPAPTGSLANDRARYVRPVTKHPLAPNVLSKISEDVQALAGGSSSAGLCNVVTGIPTAAVQTTLSAGPLRGEVPKVSSSTSASNTSNRIATALPTGNAIRPSAPTTGTSSHHSGGVNNTNSTIPRRQSRLAPSPPGRTQITTNNAATPPSPATATATATALVTRNDPYATAVRAEIANQVRRGVPAADIDIPELYRAEVGRAIVRVNEYNRREALASNAARTPILIDDDSTAVEAEGTGATSGSTGTDPDNLRDANVAQATNDSDASNSDEPEIITGDENGASSNKRKRGNDAGLLSGGDGGAPDQKRKRAESPSPHDGADRGDGEGAGATES